MDGETPSADLPESLKIALAYIEEHYFEKIKIKGDYYYPCLKAPESPKAGRFGLLYLDFLRNNKRAIYSGLLFSNKLKEHVENIDRQAEEMFSQLVEKMKQTEGVTEQLKSIDQMIR